MVKARVVPILEKELAAGALVYYDVDIQAYPMQAPGMAAVVFIASNTTAIDKVNEASRPPSASTQRLVLRSEATSFRKSHRDFLVRVA